MRSRRYRKRKITAMPEVSLTPLVDTALTLLIIFMITTPMINNAIKLQLPKGMAKEAGQEQQQELIVSIDEQGTIYFNSQIVELNQLGKTITDALATSLQPQEKSVWLKVNGPTTTCDTLVAVIDQVKVIAGVKDVNIATQMQTNKSTAHRA